METLKNIIRESVPELTHERLDECIFMLGVFCSHIEECEFETITLKYNSECNGFEIFSNGIDTDYTLFASNDYVEID